MDPRDVLREVKLPNSVPLHKRHTSPATDLAYLRDRRRMAQMGGSSAERTEMLVNKKWRLIYTMIYREEN